MSGQPIEYTLTASAETVAGLADALKRLERQNAADHKGFIESRRSIVAQRDGLAEALKASQDANAELVEQLESARRIATHFESLSAGAAEVVDEFVNIRGDWYQPHPLSWMTQRLADILGVTLRGDWDAYAGYPFTQGEVS